MSISPCWSQPQLAHKIPLLVRTALGTNLHGLGFSVRYQKFDDGLWLPVSYGTEFRLRALFFYNRSIVVSLQNTGFQRANVSSRIEFAEVQTAPSVSAGTVSPTDRTPR